MVQVDDVVNSHLWPTSEPMTKIARDAVLLGPLPLLRAWSTSNFAAVSRLSRCYACLQTRVVEVECFARGDGTRRPRRERRSTGGRRRAWAHAWCPTRSRRPSQGSNGCNSVRARALAERRNLK